MEKEHLTILLEEMNSKFNLVVEAHDALRSEIRESRDESNEKHEHTAFLVNVLNNKIDGVEKKLSDKIDGVAADLKAHRADTEAHGNAGLYVVKEG